MCEICHYTPCLSGCPNAPEPPSIGQCKFCGEDIQVGEEYFEYDGKKYHEECFSDCAVSLLMENGAELKTAEEEVPDYDPYDD